MPFAMTMPAKDPVDTRARNQLKRQRRTNIFSASGSLPSTDSSFDSASQNVQDINAQERTRRRNRVNRRRAEIFAKVKKRGKRVEKSNPAKWDPGFIHGEKSKSRSESELRDVISLPPVAGTRGTDRGRGRNLTLSRNSGNFSFT